MKQRKLKQSGIEYSFHNLPGSGHTEVLLHQNNESHFADDSGAWIEGEPKSLRTGALEELEGALIEHIKQRKEWFTTLRHQKQRT